MNHGHVYAIKAGGAVKVGYSQDPEARMTQLQGAHHEELLLLASFPGFLTHEQTAQSRLKERGLHLRGEWFRYDECLLDLFAELAVDARERIIALKAQEAFRKLGSECATGFILSHPAHEPWDREAVREAFAACADGFVSIMETFYAEAFDLAREIAEAAA